MVEDDDSARTKEESGKDPGDDAYFYGASDLGSITFLTRTSRSFTAPVGPPELLVNMMVRVERCQDRQRWSRMPRQ